MKRVFVILTALVLALSVISVSEAESERFLWQLEKVIQGDEVYWAKGITNIYVSLNKDDDGAKFTGVYYEGGEAPEYTWRFSEDVKSVIVAASENEAYEFALTDDTCRMTFQAGPDRLLVFVLRNSSGEIDEQPEDITSATWDTADLLLVPADICPVEFALWRNNAVHYRLEDGNCVLTFTTDYGEFLYVLDIITGEILDKSEPDMDAARAQEGFREPMSKDELWAIVEEQVPFYMSSAKKTRTAQTPDGNREFFIETIYGDYYYLLDGYTGEILDREEPDVDAARAQEGFREPVEANEALRIAEDASGLDIGLIDQRKVGKAGENFEVSFTSPYGDYSYIIDPMTGKILEKNEPDIDAARAQEGFTEPMTTREAMDLALGLCPVESTGINTRTGAKQTDGSFVITLGTVYGDFIYHFDGMTRELLDKQEPDIDAAAQNGVREPLSVPECLNLAEKESGLDIALILDRKVVINGNNVVDVTLSTKEYGDFFYSIDALTGTILDRIEPEKPVGGGSGDIFGDAINASTGSLAGYDYTASDIKVGMAEKNGDQIVTVTFTWKGQAYEFHYSVNERKLVD